MKTYYLTLSKVFPKDLPNAGKETQFEAAFWAGQDLASVKPFCKWKKLHTIRANYDFWKKRFEKINAGDAELSIRQWEGKPYGKGSTQREICRLTKNDGIGIQKIEIKGDSVFDGQILIDGKFHHAEVIAHNDGLDYADWCNWFSSYELIKPMAVIHFTKFRYK